MNEIIKKIVIFAVGGAVGSGITALLLTKKVVEREQKRADEKIKSHDEYVKELEERLYKAEKAIQGHYIGEEGAQNGELGACNGADEEKVSPNVANATNAAVKHDEKEPKKDQRGSFTPVVDYTAFYHGPESSEYPRERAGEEALEDVHETMNDPEKKKMGPKIIKADEYWDPEYEHHDKITLIYYVEDEVLATEEDEIIEDVYLNVGDAITKHGFATNNDKVIYVRNFSIQVDYEIDKNWGAYRDR